MNPPPTIACLGPEGSFSHLITQMRFPGVAVSLRDNVGDVFDFLASNPEALGIVPIENSSGVITSPNGVFVLGIFTILISGGAMARIKNRL